MSTSPEKHCETCGRANVSDAQFCAICGMPFALESSSAPAPIPPPVLSSSKKPMGDAAKGPVWIGGIIAVLYTLTSMALIFSSESRAAGFAMLFFEVSTVAAVLAFLTRGAFRKRYVTIAMGSSLAFIAAIACVPSSSNGSNVAVASTDTPVVADATDAPTDKPEPTIKPETYEEQRKREKREFLGGIDPTVTADKIAGNPMKYVDSNVDLHCTVSNVPQDGIVNASCGDNDTNIVLEYDEANTLDQGQAIRVLGTVDNPQQGTNSFGGAMNFPTVQVKFME